MKSYRVPIIDSPVEREQAVKEHEAYVLHRHYAVGRGFTDEECIFRQYSVTDSRMPEREYDGTNYYQENEELRILFESQAEEKRHRLQW